MICISINEPCLYRTVCSTSPGKPPRSPKSTKKVKIEKSINSQSSQNLERPVQTSKQFQIYQRLKQNETSVRNSMSRSPVRQYNQQVRLFLVIWYDDRGRWSIRIVCARHVSCLQTLCFYDYSYSTQTRNQSKHGTHSW